jgi:hypothetical protein
MWYVWMRVEMHAGFWCGNLQERYHFSDLFTHERIILKQVLLKQDGGMEWINSALRAVVYKVTNLRVL